MPNRQNLDYQKWVVEEAKHSAYSIGFKPRLGNSDDNMQWKNHDEIVWYDSLLKSNTIPVYKKTRN